MRQPKKNKRRPSLDALESRALLAGNVTVEIIDGDLLITGDSSSNYVEVYQTALDEFKVVGRTTGGSATRINGSTGGSFEYELGDLEGDIRVVMNAGNDTVYIHGNDADIGDLDAPEDLNIRMGSGNDKVDLRYVQAQTGEVRVDLSTGTDSVYANEVDAATDFTVISSFNAKVTANINNVLAGDELKVDLSNSTDIVNINDSFARTLTVKLYGSNDKLSIRRTRVSVRSSLDGGTGNDSLNFYRNTPTRFKYTSFLSPTSRNSNF